MALLCLLSLPTIQDVTIKCVGFLTNPPNLVISSPKTKGSVLPQKSRIGRVELVFWVFGECFTGQNQCKYIVHSCGVGCEERWGLTCHARLYRYLLGLLTRVSECPLCPINKCTFVWQNFSPWTFNFKYSSFPICISCIQSISPVQLSCL